MMTAKQQARAVARDAGTDRDRIQESARKVMGVRSEKAGQAQWELERAGSLPPAFCTAPADISAKPAEMRNEF